MRPSNAKPLVFLATCLAFAEATLGTLAALTDANATIVAVFALISLGMVLLSLVVMYWRDPAFLTFTGEQAFEIRRLQEILRNPATGRVPLYVGTLDERDLTQGQSSRVGVALDATEEEANELQREFDELSGG